VRACCVGCVGATGKGGWPGSAGAALAGRQFITQEPLRLQIALLMEHPRIWRTGRRWRLLAGQHYTGSAVLAVEGCFDGSGAAIYSTQEGGCKTIKRCTFSRQPRWLQAVTAPREAPISTWIWQANGGHAGVDRTLGGWGACA